MKFLILTVSILTAMIFFSCSSTKTVFITNKLGKAITIQVDSNFSQENSHEFKTILNGKKIDNKLKVNFGNGKWNKQDKADLENLFAHTRFLDINNFDTRAAIEISYIRLGVEELWVILQ